MTHRLSPAYFLGPQPATTSCGRRGWPASSRRRESRRYPRMGLRGVYDRHMNTPPNRANHPGRQVGAPGHAAPQPLNMVRGGSVCDPQEQGGHLMKGSGSAAICMATPGVDQRPRWRQAGKIGGKSRHSTHFEQHR